MNPTVLSVFDIDPLRVGGTEVFARELSSQLATHGWRSVLCFASRPPDLVRSYLELPNVSLEVVENPSRLRLQPIRDLARLLRRYRPYLLHLHFTPFLSPHPWLAKLCSVKRVFFTDHTSRPAFYVPRRPGLWKRLAARAISLPMSGVVSVSDFNLRCLAALGAMPADRIRRIYNGVELTRTSQGEVQGARFRQKYSIPPDCSLVVQVGWIIPEKGIPDLLAAARLAVMRNPKVHFALVGEGAYRERFTEEAVQMGLGNHVTWTGSVADPFAEGVYAAADVVCQISHWEEAFGWSIAEAMASSKPVVATRVGGIPELVRDAECGFVVARGDTTAIAEKILLLVSDPSLRERMGKAGREAVEARFDVKTNVAQVLKFYGLGGNNVE